MKKLFGILVVGLVVLSSCKKDYTCECSTRHYVDGYYSHETENEYTVKNSTECASYEKNTSVEVTTCVLDDND
ncbi:MAG TPA: hypothetical protein VKZ44_00085 [Taishania sp.]|nr:hypothetical protein [Taishania sp.]